MKTCLTTLAVGLSAFAAAQSPVRAEFDCQPMHVGAAPIQNTTSIEAFEEDPFYSDVAGNATTPFGYQPAFFDLTGAYQNDETYLSYVPLREYSTDLCGAVCAAKDGCESFNLYVLRIPTLVCTCTSTYRLSISSKKLTIIIQSPGPDCPNPPASATVSNSGGEDAS
jgi:hypothetical protein